MSQMLKSTGALGVATLTSRLLGMVREMVYAGFMGDSVVAGAFKTALMIPNLFRRLLGEGALTAAFIPIFKEKEKQAGEAEMWKAANAVLSGLLIASSIIIVLVVAGISLTLFLGQSPSIAAAMTKAGTVHNATLTWMKPSTRLMLELARIMFPYMLLVCVAAVYIGMLNARGHFFVPAFGASILNVVLITSVLVVAPFFGKTLDIKIYVLAVGVLVAGVAQLLYQLPYLYKEGYRWKWVTPFGNPVVKRVVRQMLPGMLGVAAFQFNVLTTTTLAFLMDPTIVASYDYAVRLMEFPQGLFGISLATYLLPTLSGLAADKKYGEFRSTYKQAVGYLFFSNLLASILLLILAKPMIRLLFQHGNFDAGSTIRSTFALQCLGPGLLAFSMVNITARAFYALGDTQTPMKISAFCLVLNIIFALWLLPPLQQGGMGVANTLSATLNVYLLIYGLKRKLSKLDFADLKPLLFQMLTAGILAGLFAYGTSYAWEEYVGGGRLVKRIGAVFVPIGISALVYIGTLLWLKVPQAQDILNLLRGKFRRSAP
ncbi:MAG: murein biosynthesis integral membrane protein MurJ [Verrucomicrobiota bacterium]